MIPVIVILCALLTAAVWLLTPPKHSLRVLMYHKVSGSHTDFLTVTPEQLSRHIQYIKDNGYRIISLSELLESIRLNTKLPPDSVLLSFDDGYQNNYELAYPVLQKHNAKACIFIVPSFTGRQMLYDGTEQQFLGTEQMKAMSPLVEYGWHSWKHDSYAKLSAAEIEEDIKACKEYLTESSGISVLPCLAYPYGAYPKKDIQKRNAMFEALRKSGIIAAFRIGNRINRLPLKNNMLIQRIDIRGNESFGKFKSRLRRGRIF